MTSPSNDAPLEANLSTVTDEEWLAAHQALSDTGAIPQEELQYVWDPDLDPAVFIDPEETDEAPNG